MALLQAIPALDLVELVGDEAVGLGILRRALEAPIRQIADNAGAHGEVIVEHVKTSARGHGFDALKGEYGDMFKKGIVDAAKVTRSALQNAASIAAMVLTTETLDHRPAGEEADPCPPAAAVRRGHGLLDQDHLADGPSRRPSLPRDVERDEALAVEVDIGLQVGDPLLGRSDRIGAGDESASGRRLARDRHERLGELGRVA